MELLLFFLNFLLLFQEFQTSRHFNCGNRPLYNTLSPESQNQKELNAEKGEWPWVASIQRLDMNTYEHICTGTVLNNQWIFTAAHCFRHLNGENDIKSLQVVLGAHLLSEKEKHIQVLNVKQIIQHELYDPKVQYYDIALIQLNKPVQLNDYVQPACLPMSSATLEPLTECYLAGWGVRDEGDEPVAIMQEVKVERINSKRCNKTYLGAIQEYHLCASQKANMKSCQGDSAAPLMCKRKTSTIFSVIGIASWGSGCSQINSPGIYTSTKDFVKWMVEKVTSEEIKSKTKVKESVLKMIVPFEKPPNPSAKEEKNVESSVQKSQKIPFSKTMNLLMQMTTSASKHLQQLPAITSTPESKPIYQTQPPEIPVTRIQENRSLKKRKKQLIMQKHQEALSIAPKLIETEQNLEDQSQDAQSEQTNTVLQQLISAALKLKAGILGLFQKTAVLAEPGTR
uniref:Peptidase S1 domain-containing protein n=2 Tax=Xenopus tropicalis TaxID=8364 RepID=F6R3Q1_XENTR